MPVSAAYAASNRSQTERLRSLIGRMTAEQYQVRLRNGWTVSGALAHIAFWDRQRLCLMRRWAAGKECSGAYDGELFNETMQPLLELIPADRVAKARPRSRDFSDQTRMLSTATARRAASRPGGERLRERRRRRPADILCAPLRERPASGLLGHCWAP